MKKNITPEKFSAIMKRERIIGKLNKLLTVLLLAAVLNLVLLFFGINTVKYAESFLQSEKADEIINSAYNALKTAGEYIKETFFNR